MDIWPMLGFEDFGAAHWVYAHLDEVYRIWMDIDGVVDIGMADGVVNMVVCVVWLEYSYP